ncbi:hypothetical protein NB311A_15202 [Nitrobacter sp. Nb-311A]|nr:hypothetical protein NB311A_15202 [Nitrobacter sp. Nb-311A]
METQAGVESREFMAGEAIRLAAPTS